MEFESINPYNGEKIAVYKEHSNEEVASRLQRSVDAFKAWQKRDVSERGRYIDRLATLLNERQESFARIMTLEMGKPITQSRAELEKCAALCRYYVDHAAAFLEPVQVEARADQSLVRFDPIGTVLGIMPWNFPFWQVFRFAVPSLMAGNAVLLKHAPNVFGCAVEIEKLFLDAGLPDAVFQNLILHHEKIESVIADDAVNAVTLTGSERAGRSVAMLAGKYLKKSVLELGGSNAFIVLEDADMERTIHTALKARFMNSGQSCIAAKRFILVGEKVRETFTEAFLEGVKPYVKCNPLDEKALIGPLARIDLAQKLQRQIKESVSSGAQILYGGTAEGAFHEPTVLNGVCPGMSAFDEETFGPLAALVCAGSEKEAFDLAANSRYGLGLTVFTSDPERILDRAPDVPDGAFFINDLVKSDPRLPFGGTRNSGYGRELARDGMLEFVNRKTVCLNR